MRSIADANASQAPSVPVPHALALHITAGAIIRARSVVRARTVARTVARTIIAGAIIARTSKCRTEDGTGGQTADHAGGNTATIARIGVRRCGNRRNRDRRSGGENSQSFLHSSYPVLVSEPLSATCGWNDNARSGRKFRYAGRIIKKYGQST